MCWETQKNLQMQSLGLGHRSVSKAFMWGSELSPKNPQNSWAGVVATREFQHLGGKDGILKLAS